MRSIRLRHITSSVIILLLVVMSILSSMLTHALIPTSDSVVNANANQQKPIIESESIQSLNDVSCDFEFEIASESVITNDNLNNFATVCDFHSQTIKVSVVKSQNGYIVKPPHNLYTPGCSYNVTLFSGVTFTDEKIKDNEKLIFTIKRDDVEKVIMNSNIKEIPSESILAIEEDYIVLKTGDYVVGDILYLSTGIDGTSEPEARKIISIDYCESGLLIETEIPSVDEVYDVIDIAGTYSPKPQDIMVYGEQEIVAEVAKLASVQSISRAVAEYSDSSSEASVMFDKSVTADGSFGLSFDNDKKCIPDSIKVKIKHLGFGPFELAVQITLEWDIVKKSIPFATGKLKFIVVIDLICSFEVYSNINSATNEYKETTISKTTATVKFELELNWKNKINGIGLITKITKDYWNTKDGLKDYLGTVMGDEQNLSNTNLSKANEAYLKLEAEKKNQILSHIYKLSQAYRECRDKDTYKGGEIVPLAKIIFVLPHGICINLVCGFVFSIDLKANFGGSYTYTQNDETGQIITENGTFEYNNQYICHTVSLYCTGKLGITIGLGVEFKATYLNVFYASVKFRTGAYVEISGSSLLSFDIGSKRALELDSSDPDGASVTEEINKFFDVDFKSDCIPFLGFGNLDIGKYRDLKLEAGCKLKILGVTLEISVSVTTTWKQTMLDAGNDADTYSDLIIAEDLPNDKAERFDEEYLESSYMSLNDVVFSNVTYDAKVPQIYKRRIDLNSGEIRYESVPTDQLVYLNNNNVNVNMHGEISLRDPAIQQFEDMLFITFIDQQEYDEIENWITLRVIKNPIPVEVVNLEYTGQGITVDGSDSIITTYLPKAASYTKTEYSIAYIKDLNGELLQNNLGNYASISNDATVRVHYLCRVGYLIGVQARVIHDNVISNIIEIRVIKTSVREVRIIPDGLNSDIKQGGYASLNVFVNPSNATYQNASYIIVSGLDYGYIDADRLYCNSDVPVNSEIKVVAIVDGVSSPEFVFRVGVIPVESVIIRSRATGLELPNITKIQIGSRFELEVLVAPSNTTELNYHYEFTQNDCGLYVDENEVLVVPDNPKMVDSVVRLIAVYGNVNSREYRFKIEKMPVESVELYTENNKSDIFPGSRLQLYTNIAPNNATYYDVVYSQLSSSEHSTINKYGQLYVYDGAPIGMEIKISASVENISSNIVTLIVVKIPVESVTIGVTNSTNRINENTTCQINWNVLPSNASYTTAAFKIIDGSKYASVSDDGLIVVHDNIGTRDAKITVCAIADGIESNILAFDIIVPVRSVSLSTSDGIIDSLQLGQFTKLVTSIDPYYSTVDDVEYTITQNFEYVNFDSFTGYLSVKTDLDGLDKYVGLVAKVDGIYSNELFIKIVKVPVFSVEFSESEVIAVGLGKSYQLYAHATPANATFADVVYRLKDNHVNAILNVDVVEIPITACVDQTVKVIATIDGVDSIPLTIKAVPVLVEFLRISAERALLYQNDQIQIVCETNEDATEKNLNFRILSGNEYASITESGLLVINEVIPKGDAQVTVIASSGGVESNKLVFDIFVNVNMVYIEVSSYEVKVGDSFALEGHVNENATIQNTSIEIIDGSEYIGSITDNTYTVIDPKISNATITFRATASDFDGEYIIAINIIVPVCDVELFISDTQPKQGDTILVTAEVFPAYATYRTTTFEILNGIHGIEYNNQNNQIGIGSNVPVGTEIHVRVFADGIYSDIQTITVNKVPVSNVDLSLKNEIYQMMQGQSVELATEVYPINATYKSIEYVTVAGESLFYITDNILTINKDATVGSNITVIAIADGISTSPIVITVLKVPVTDITISAGGVKILRAKETLQFSGVVNEDATYKEITYSLVSGDKYATISSSGLLVINDYVDIGNAYVRVIGTADGTSSSYYEIEIFNPITSIEISANVLTLCPGSEFILYYQINDNATSNELNIQFLKGESYITLIEDNIELRYKKYQVDSNIHDNAPSIYIRAHKSGINSKNDIEISIYIAVEEVEIKNISDQTVIHQNEKIWLMPSIYPNNATNSKASYMLIGNPVGIALDINTGMLTIDSSALTGSSINIYAKADGISSRIYSLTIGATLIRTEYKIVEIGKSVKIFAGEIGDLVAIKVSDNASIEYVRGIEWLLTVNSNALNDSVIYVCATINGIDSIIEITVVDKILVEAIDVRHNATATILQGSTIQINATIYPSNASNMSIGYIIYDNPEIATIDDNGLISINKKISSLNKTFSAKCYSIDNPLVYEEFSFNVFIPLDSFVIEYTLLDSDRLISTPTTVSTVLLNAKLSPENATIENIYYEYLKFDPIDPDYAIISGDILSIKSNIQISNASFIVNATIGAIVSQTTFNIIIPVEKVMLSTTSIAPMQGTNIEFSTNVLPLHSTYSNGTYYLKENITGIELDNLTGSVSISQSVAVGTKFSVYAIVDGVESESITVTVQKIPVQSISIDASGVKVVNAGEYVEFIGHVLPLNATYGNIAYKIFSGNEYASITADGRLKINDYIPIGSAKVVVIGIADDVCSNYYEIEIFNSVTYIELVSSMLTVAPGDEFTIYYTVNDNASNTDVNIVLLAGADYVSLVETNIQSNYVKYRVNSFITDLNPTLKIRGSKDGIVSKCDLDILIYIAVESVGIVNISNGMLVHQNEKIILNAIFKPSNATYNAVTYTLISDTNHIALSNGVLIIDGMAAIDYNFSLFAMVDGIDSPIYMLKVASSLLRAEYNVVEKGKTLKIYAGDVDDDVQVSVSSDSTIEFIEGNEWLLSASSNAMGGIIVTVTAIINGQESAIDIKIVEHIATTSLLVNHDHHDPQSVNLGDKIRIHSTVYPLNASNRVVGYNTDANFSKLATIDVNTGKITINDHVEVMNKTFTVEIYVAGYEDIREILVFTIYVPLDDFTINIDVVDSADNSGRITSSNLKGSTINLSVKLSPINATVGVFDYEYVKAQNIDPIFASIEGSILEVSKNIIQSMAKFKIKVKIGSIEREIAINVIIPVVSIDITTDNDKPMQGESVTIVACPTNMHATYATPIYMLQDQINGVTVDKLTGVLTIKDNVPVNTTITVFAIIDGVKSNNITLTVQKIPVQAVKIATTSEINTILAGESIQFIGFVTNSNATYKTITYSFADGLLVNKYATITTSGKLLVNDPINTSNAVLSVIGTADGIVSDIYEVAIFNPITYIEISSDKVTGLKQGDEFTITVITNDYATDKNVDLLITNSTFIELIDKFNNQYRYRINVGITAENPTVIFHAYKGTIICASDVTIYIQIDATGALIRNLINNQQIHQNQVLALDVGLVPSNANSGTISYALKSHVLGITLDSLSGELFVSPSSSIGDMVTICLLLDGYVVVEYTLNIAMSLISSDYSVVERGKTLPIMIGGDSSTVTTELSTGSNIATIKRSNANIWLLTTNKSTNNNTEIIVTARINDTKHRYIVTVLSKIEVTGLSVIQQGPQSNLILPSNTITFNYSVLPLNASLRNINYTYCSNFENIASSIIISESSIAIKIEDTITVSNKNFRISIYAADNTEALKVFEFSVYIPLISYSIRATIIESADGSNAFTSTETKGSYANLSILPNPFN
ncbi:MAG: Ig-like domain-containing protein, partial [Christensenellaceae bacterium]|nr:Ig-like domain-containing protein [Christensenellaceae bacterium]